MVFLKVGLSTSKKVVFICLNEHLLKETANAFYFMLRLLFVLEIFTFLSRLFNYEEKRLDNKQLQYIYCSISQEVKATRQ